MACRTIPLGDGTFAITCSRGSQRKACSVPNCTGAQVALCDYPVVRKGKPGTCSKGVCATHRWPGSKDGEDHCPPHHELTKRQAAGAAGGAG